MCALSTFIFVYSHKRDTIKIYIMLKEIKVPEISCEHCANTIDKTLIELEGINKVKVEVSNKSVLIEHTEDMDMDQVRSHLLDQGYTVDSE